MRIPPQIAMLSDGRRLHLQDGPIDLVIEAFGTAPAIALACSHAAQRFSTILDELCSELTLLRTEAQPGDCPLQGRVAQRMHRAVEPFAAASFITPMAAVAGAVAEEVLAAMMDTPGLTRAYVNNGGDIALHLAAGTNFTIGMVDRPDQPNLFGNLRIEAGDDIRGIATSGWRGRSFSFGVADAVTILARGAAEADAAATIVANEVGLPAGHPAVLRVPAHDIQPDSDLGARLVTRGVGCLTEPEIDLALAAGAGCAEALVRAGLIDAAALHLQGRTRIVGAPNEGAQPAPCGLLRFQPRSHAQHVRKDLAHV
jgi:ApbE superfamily uncharacterized protein (UPF0280 family)